MFGTPRKEAAVEETKTPRPKGPETSSFPSPTKAMKEGLDQAEISSQMVARKTSELSKLGRKGNVCTGKKEMTTVWHHILTSRVRNVLGDVGIKLLTKEGFTEEDLKGLEEWQVYYVKGCGDYLYGMVMESIDQDEKWGRAMLQSVINEDANINGSVGRLVDHIVKQSTNMTCDMAKVRLMEIDELKISLNDTPEDMEIVVNELLSKWMAIPEQYRGHPYLLYEKLLNLYPQVCADDKKSLQTNINTLQTMGQQMPTYEQLGQGIITSIIKFRLVTPNALWAGRGNGGGGGGGGGGGDRKPWVNKCSNCLGDHKPWDCPKQCSACKTSFCGSKGDSAKCPCKNEKLVEREKIINGLGNVIGENLYNKLKIVHTKMHGGSKTLITTSDEWGSLVGNARDLSLMVLPGKEYPRCAQCVDNGDPRGETIQNDLKCGGGYSQCERRCVCKSVSDYGLKLCGDCDEKFCAVHIKTSHKCVNRQLKTVTNFVNEVVCEEAFDDEDFYIKPSQDFYSHFDKAVKDREAKNTLMALDMDHMYDTTKSLCLVGDPTIKGMTTCFAALDSCSYHHLTNSKRLCEVLGELKEPSIKSLGGVNSGNPAMVQGAVRNVTIYLPTQSGGVAQAVLDELLYVPNSPCTIIGQNKMWDHNGWKVRAEDTMRVELPGGEQLKLYTQQSLPSVRIYASGQVNLNAEYTSLVTMGDRNKEVLLWHARMWC